MTIKLVLKRIIYRSKALEYAMYKLRKIKSSRCEFENLGYGRYRIESFGKNNKIFVGKDTMLKDTFFRICGNNNKIIIDEQCQIGPKCSFWVEGNNSNIHIGKNTSFTQIVHFCAQEDNVSIMVGEDCMFSNNIIVRTSDSHPIYSIDSGERINHPKNVIIGNHVWIAPNSKVMKGVRIGDGSIIGSDTLVTKDIPDDVLAVGHPAKVVRERIHWTRDSLF